MFCSKAQPSAAAAFVGSLEHWLFEYVRLRDSPAKNINRRFKGADRLKAHIDTYVSAWPAKLGPMFIGLASTWRLVRLASESSTNRARWCRNIKATVCHHPKDYQIKLSIKWSTDIQCMTLHDEFVSNIGAWTVIAFRQSVQSCFSFVITGKNGANSLCRVTELSWLRWALSELAC